MRRVRVLIADDDDRFRGALRDVLDADGRYDVVLGVATGHDLPALVERHRPDVVLLDVRMPGGGIGAAQALAARAGASTGPAVVVLSAQTSLATVVAMLRAGAVGYLAKGRIGAHLPDLVGRCAAGEVVLAVPSAAEALRQLASEPG